MISEKILRPVLFLAVALVHGLLIVFLAFNVGASVMGAGSEEARIMKLTDIEEEPPPPPAPEERPVVEEIAETMIETDTPPDQTVVAAGTLLTTSQAGEDYLPMHRVSIPPRFDERLITQALIYPPIALRSGIEGRVILELFIDRTGRVQRITVLQENPAGRGFGEAAVRAFEGQRCSPAEANGEPVSVRYRYPVAFRIR
ncbi:MAG: energy transducer TonB [Treponema sp.]|jgi:protein TonB|nr:energy transducer TonB [Treponema sp.]